MRSAAGFSLIEVMVSIIILAIALLGTAGLMSTSLKNTNNSYYRSQATVLADDILDRMRANKTAARGYMYNADLGAAPAACAVGNTMAVFDCTEWKNTLANVLPGGDGTVTVDSNGVVTIVILWNGDDNSFTTESRL